MIKISEDNNSFMRCLTRSIRDIADAEYQERVWVRHEGNLIDSFEDSTTEFLDRCEIILEDYRNYGLDEEKFKMLKKMYDEIFDYFFSEESNKKDEEILKDPHWHQIRDFAKKVYIALSKIAA